ncbi:MAG: CPBP family intramembrane metalloprotease [Caldilinea sp. CFX5]|nr:CPBP family intramembrane metalloprotease [Caldilinea sp. CFX5]
MSEITAQRDQMRKPVAPFLAYLLLFHGAWVFWVYQIYPWLVSLGETTPLYALINSSLRLLIWVLPVFLYLCWIDGVDPLAYLKLRAHWQRGIMVGLLVTLVNFLLSLVRYGWPQPALHALTWNHLFSTFLLIGLIEEIPYRGFILQKLQERFNFWFANLLTSLLFVAIHLPGWLKLDLLRGETVIFVFGFGLVMGLIFRYAQSLWSVIVAHSLNDFLAGFLFKAVV